MFTLILSSQLHPESRRNVLIFYWTGMTDAFIFLTETEVNVYFRDKKDLFLQNFQDNEEKRWKITLKDLGTIQYIRPVTYQMIFRDKRISFSEDFFLHKNSLLQVFNSEVRISG